MPLLDHFHVPVSQRRTWEGFHSLWAAALVEWLNEEILAEEYFADLQVHIGGQLEVDVATPEETTGGRLAGQAPGGAWAPPPAALAMPAVFPDDIEVRVFATSTGAALVGAIELVSPGNKDRPETRRAFAAKCVSYLTRGIGLIVVDLVTNRAANLHNEIVELMGNAGPYLLADDCLTYAVAYRPARDAVSERIEMWPAPLRVGEPLPLLPLALRNAGVVPVDLESTYSIACERSRLRRAA